MDNETKQLIDKNIANLSPLMRRAIKTVGVEEIFQDLTSEFNMHVDVANQVYVLVWLVILGIEDIDGLQKGLEGIEELNEKEVQEIGGYLKSRVFEPIRKYVLQESNTEKETASQDSNGTDGKENKDLVSTLDKNEQALPRNLPTQPEPEKVKKEEKKEVSREETAPPRYGSTDPYREPLDNE